MNAGETVGSFAARVGAQFVGSFLAGAALAVLLLLYLEWRIRQAQKQYRQSKGDNL